MHDLPGYRDHVADLWTRISLELHDGADQKGIAGLQLVQPIAQRDDDPFDFLNTF